MNQPTPAPTDTVELGVNYLRVSSKRQLDTAADVDPDGNSINTQREYTQDKARSMGVILQREFIEPGNSAQSIDKRPVFIELLTYLKNHPEIKYVFIYMRSRAFRDYIDAGVTERQLGKMGVKLISAKEDFGEGVMARAMKAVTDIMNDVQVKLSGQDIAVKMLNKAKNGGTNGRAKLGYLNGTVNIDGRKVNTIVLDEERAKYVVMGFELCATGKYPNAESIQAALTDAGLRMPGSGKPVSIQTVYKMLRDRYYLGYVTYKGVEYANGRHPKLITPELFEKVQAVLDSHSGSGARQRNYHHYLKGTVWCGRCRSRYTIQRGLGNGGEYFYFMCRGRQDGHCDQKYVPVEVMEDVVAKHYRTEAWMPQEVREAMRVGVEAAVASHQGLSDELRASLEAQLAKGQRKESYLIDLAAEEDWPKDVLRDKVQAIRDERARIRRQLDDSATQLEAGRQVFLRALDLLDEPAEMYATAKDKDNEGVCSILNRAFFSKLYVDGGKVTDHELNEPFNMLHEAYTIYRQLGTERHGKRQRRTYHRTSGALALAAELAAVDDPAELAAWLDNSQTANSAVSLAEPSAVDDLRTAATWENFSQELALALAGQGWSNDAMVGAEGLEPPTLSV